MRPQPLVSPRPVTLRRLTGRLRNTLAVVCGRRFTQKTRPEMRKPGLLFFLLTGALTLSFSPQVHAQVRDREQSRREHLRPLIVQDVDENKRLTLHGNTHPEARPENDRGKVADDYLIEHMLLQLKRPPEQERALEKFLEEQQTPGSPN